MVSARLTGRSLNRIERRPGRGREWSPGWASSMRLGDLVFFTLPKKRSSLPGSITSKAASSRSISNCSWNSTMSLQRNRVGSKSMLREFALRIYDSLVDHGWPCI